VLVASEPYKKEMVIVRRIKVILAAVAALMMMAVFSAPAMAQSYYWDPAWLGNTATDPSFNPNFPCCDPNFNPNFGGDPNFNPNFNPNFSGDPNFNPNFWNDDCDWDGC
jgi:hypothetical protein